MGVVIPAPGRTVATQHLKRADQSLETSEIYLAVCSV